MGVNDKIIRKWLVTMVICLMAMVFVLSGCSSPAPAPTTSAPKPAAPTTAAPATSNAPAATSATTAPAPALTTTTSAAPQKVRELKFSSLLSGSGDAGAAFQQAFCDDVDKMTNGAVKIKIYWAKQLAEPKDIPEMLRQGTIDVAAFPPGDFPALLPINEQIQGYATLTNDPRVAHDYWFGLMAKVPEVLTEFNKANMQFLCRQFNSTKYMITKNPLKTTADCKGLQFRVPGAQYLADVCAALGATRVMIPLADVYEAFMRNSISGTLLGTDLLYTQKYYEIGKYVGLPLGCEPFWTMAINLTVYKSFTPEIQQAFVKASQNFDDATMAAALGMDVKYKPLLTAQGVQFIEFSQTDWQAALAKVGDQMTYFKKTMASRNMSEVADRMAPIWSQLVKDAQTKYNTK